MEDFLGGLFWRNFFGRIFLEEVFGRNFWEDFFWEDFFESQLSYLNMEGIDFFVKILVFVKILSKSKKDGRKE